MSWNGKRRALSQGDHTDGIDMGLHMMQVPEEYGGMGLDTTTTAMMIEEGAKVESTYMGDV